MKILARLENSASFWFLTIASFLFFLFRLPSLFEPYWYGDEGIYQTIGLALNRGLLLYRDIWDNKPPLLYILYAILNSDQFLTKMISLVFGIFSLIVFFCISRLAFKTIKTSIVTTSIFGFLLAIPALEGNIANAENFMLLPILISTFLILKYNLSKLFPAGILISLAFLFKIVAVFDFTALLLFIIIANWNEKPILRQIEKVFPFVLGFAVPLILTFIFFVLNRAGSDFLNAVFSSNVGYVGNGNAFVIPQGLLIVKLSLLFLFITVLFLRRKSCSKATLFILLWTAFSLFNAFFSQRPYTHYLLVLLPSISLLLGVVKENVKVRRLALLLLVFSLITIFSKFAPNFQGTFKYYENYFSFISSKKSVLDYREFFDRKTPIDYELTFLLKPKLDRNDSVFIFGNNAQVYKMLGVLPPGKFIVAYHILQDKKRISDTEKALLKAKSKFVIVMPEQKKIPFSLVRYREKANIQNALIYERIF